MKTIFNDIYAHNVWNCGSGEGSLPHNTRAYRKFLDGFLRRKQIRSVVDYGCGDWQFSRLVNWGDVQYLGLDLVEALIEQNQRQYQTDHIRFAAIDEAPARLPDADLILLKDVLQHWSNEAIFSFLPKLASYRYALITNCVNPGGETVNRDIADGDWRHLDLRLPPFSCAMEKVFEFTNNRWVLGFPHGLRFRKIVLLQQNGATS